MEQEDAEEAESLRLATGGGAAGTFFCRGVWVLSMPESQKDLAKGKCGRWRKEPDLEIDPGEGRDGPSKLRGIQTWFVNDFQPDKHKTSVHRPNNATAFRFERISEI